jgi:P-type Ca2+ transporter type 2C
MKLEVLRAQFFMVYPINLRAPAAISDLCHLTPEHLIIDPACSVVLEAEPGEINVMNRPPRNPQEPVFGRKNLGLALLQGLGILVIILVIYLHSLARGQGELDARALTLFLIIFLQKSGI